MSYDITEQDFRRDVSGSIPSEHAIEYLLRTYAYWFSIRLAVEIMNDVWLNSLNCFGEDYHWESDGDEPSRPVSYTHLTLPTIYSV